MKASKCVFRQQELEYLCHIITNHGVKVDKANIEAMVAWPRPTNITNLRDFLGLTSYYQAMTTTPILAMQNFNETFTIETNTYGDNIGAILTQHGQPIAFMSRALGITK